ncbi:MAG: hypothetical protein GEV28_22430 [Actinophytocola sp.]|uniref:hypothetical protein n=1 Tax=Actinophytocola sp. TaxID=1872138 RepID=UPI00132C7CBE|nr:hypothetical protein [Actinophytocola sp.]MPZ82996.1 hypothetical protein [Actinophytocola sp.]
MLVLECAWRRGDTDFAMLDDTVGVRGRAAHADSQYYGVWRRAKNTLLVCGRESEWAPQDVELIPQHWDVIINGVVFGMFVAEALAGRPHLTNLQFAGHDFRIVDGDPGLAAHIALAHEAVQTRTARQVFSTPHGTARLTPGDLPDAYAAHIEWGPRSRPLAIIPGPDTAPWDDAIRWAKRWAHTALVRHADLPAERLTLHPCPNTDGPPAAT